MSSKYRQLTDLLRSELAGLARSGQTRLPTEQELAARYHMSRQTVRHALQLLEAEGLILRQQGRGTFIAEALQRTSQRRIALLVHRADAYLTPAFIHDLRSALTAENCTLTVHATDGSPARERQLLQTLAAEHVTGVVCEAAATARPSVNADLFQLLAQRGVPVVLLGSANENLAHLPLAAPDHEAGATLLTRHLLHQGRRRFGGVFCHDDRGSVERFHALCRTLLEADLPLPESSILWLSLQDVYHPEDAHLIRQLDAFLDRITGDCDALVCATDELAHLLLNRMLLRGVRVPQDMAIAGMDNSYLHQLGPVPLTSVGPRRLRPGAAAARLLLTLLSGSPAASLKLPMELFPRSST